MQTRIWKEWEKETCSLTYEFSYGSIYFYQLLFHMLQVKCITYCQLFLLSYARSRIHGPYSQRCLGFPPQAGSIYFILLIPNLMPYLTFADPSKFRLTHQTSFVRQHASCWSKITILLYVVSWLMTPRMYAYQGKQDIICFSKLQV